MASSATSSPAPAPSLGLRGLFLAGAEPSAPPPLPGLMRLRCAVQHYGWGRRGADSLVARLAAAAAADDDRPFAELWAGTHPSAPSALAPDVSLRDWLARNPAALGRAVAARWGGDLPFLLKVLSVARALSIQAHPDGDLARALHALRPDAYRDANHKPEMAVAVSEFQALCGFAGTQELKEVFRTVPEVQQLAGKEEAQKLMSVKEQDGGIGVRSYLRSAFTNVMLASEEAVSKAVSELKSRLDGESKIRALTDKEKLVLSLEEQYPGDVGVLAAFFFNHVKLHPGEALYVGANEPHAYLSGECIECMATSDNVVRAGLTPKYRDVQTLCSMLTYNQKFPEILRGVAVQQYVTRYTPPTDEFEVDHYAIPPGESVTTPAVPGPSVFLVMAGRGEIRAAAAAAGSISTPDDDVVVEAKLKEGDVFFVPAYTEVNLHASGGSGSGSGPAAAADGCTRLYRAGVNSVFLG